MTELDYNEVSKVLMIQPPGELLTAVHEPALKKLNEKIKKLEIIVTGVHEPALLHYRSSRRLCSLCILSGRKFSSKHCLLHTSNHL